MRAVVNRIQVAGSDRGDSELARAVERALLYHPATDEYEIEVRASDGTVKLTGTVQSWAEKQLCVSVAKDVRNRLSVKFTYRGPLALWKNPKATRQARTR